MEELKISRLMTHDKSPAKTAIISKIPFAPLSARIARFRQIFCFPLFFLRYLSLLLFKFLVAVSAALRLGIFARALRRAKRMNRLLFV